MNETKELLLDWTEQFENDHYIYEVYGQTLTADVPKETVKKIIDIAILLVDRVKAAKGDLSSSEYEELEGKVREEYPDINEMAFHVMLKAINDEHLFGRYLDIEPMVGELLLRGYEPGSAAYLLLIKPVIHQLIYAVVRHVDEIDEKYTSLAYTFFIGVITKGWSEGNGWTKTENGTWEWKSTD